MLAFLSSFNDFNSALLLEQKELNSSNDTPIQFFPSFRNYFLCYASSKSQSTLTEGFESNRASFNMFDAKRVMKIPFKFFLCHEQSFCLGTFLMY